MEGGGWVYKGNVGEVKYEPPTPTVSPVHVPSFRDTIPPEIHLSEETRGLEIVAKGRKVKISGYAYDKSGIDKVIIGEKEIEGNKKEKVDFSLTLIVSPERDYVNIKAIDSYGNTARMQYFITQRITFKPPEAIRAVVIGISNYKNPSLRLRYAVNDAEILKNFLLSKYVRVKENDLIYLTDEKAKRDIIIKSIENVLRTSGVNDLVIIYMAMHAVPQIGELFFLPYEADPKNILGTGIAQSDILRAIKLSKVEKIVFIFDACHSGGFGEVFAFARGTYSSETFNLLKEIAKARAGIAVLSAASSGEYSYENKNLRHGIFTYYLVNGLKGEADTDGDGYVRLREIYEYVLNKVSKATNGKQHPDLDGGDNLLPLSQVK